MLMKKWIVFVSIVGLLLLAACSEAMPAPTAVSEPAEPTAATEETVAQTTDRQSVPMGRFSFIPVAGYEWDVEEGEMYMGNADGMIMLSVVGVPTNGNTPEEIMNDFVGGMAMTGSGKLEQDVESVIVVDGVEGTAVNLSGDLFGSPIEGQAILVQPTDDWAIFALAMGNLSENTAQWSAVGQPFFTDILGSMEFLDETAVAELLAVEGGACPVAIDPTYGYSQDNPVQVGGDEENDSARATAYLDNLIDPVGIPIAYRPAGSAPHGDTVISIYEISSPMVEETVKFYIDQYNYSELMAPVGFSCEQMFPISAP